MRNGQNVRIDGKIATDSYLYNGVKYNFDGVYNYEEIHLSDSFLLYEHNGLNYFFAGVNRFDNFNKLLGIATDKFEVNLEEGIDFGFVMPKTSTTILGNEKYVSSDIVGFGMSVSAGLNLTFFKYFFIKAAIKYGYIDIKDSRVTISDASATVQQHFDFIEPSYNIGFRFPVFSTKKKYKKPIDDTTILEQEVSETETETKPLNSDIVIVEENETSVENNTNIDSTKCTGKKEVEYKEKSENTTDKAAQKGYSWLSLYYKYKCRCTNGTRRPAELKGIINNVVDSYLENTGGVYGEISKVSKCKSLTKD